MEVPAIVPGTRVRARRRMWVVTAVDAGDRCRLLTLAGTSADNARHQLAVVQPFDDVEPIGETGRLRQVGTRTWQRACRAAILDDFSPASLRTACHARIDLLEYQLEPALALLQGRGTRILIADEVGLGKTVQAALAIAELRVRGAAGRVLILCPAGLREQWVDECRERFNLELCIFDQTGVRRSRSTLPIGVNPWSTEPLVIASIDFVKRADVLPAVLAAPWDVVTIDEAHGVAGASDRHAAAAALCGRATYVLLLTATPHSGDDDAFASLCAIGSHARITNAPPGDALVVFRRSRLEAGRDAGRRVHTIGVRLGASERAMHAALGALTAAIRRERSDMNRPVSLMLSLLHKRALSSAFALASSAERRVALLDCPAEPTDEQLALPFDMAGELDYADVAPMWSTPALQDRREEQRLLRRVVTTARDASGCEGKFRRLRRILETIREPAIVFTEYRDTLMHVRDTIAPYAPVVHGGLSREQRRAALDRFPDAGVLLATDAAGEGLNLHRHCRVVINLELPWNPMRLEQRIGRVDRIGQTRRVHAFHLIAAGTGETTLLDRLSARVTKAQVRVGAPDPLRGRPEWTEEQSADLVVFGRVSADDAGRSRPDDARVPLTRLPDVAATEHGRLLVARRVAAAATVAGDSAARVVDVPVIAEHRNSSVRTRLGNGSLVVFRTCVTDRDGRRVACRLDSLLVEHLSWADVATGDGDTTDTRLTGLLSFLTNLSGRRDWIERSIAVSTQFAAARCARARQLLELVDQPASPLQPGLFDRRVEHEQTLNSAIQKELAFAARERVVSAEAAAELCVSKPVLLLVLGVRASRPLS